MKKVLVVLTNVPNYQNTIDLTGLWLSEATEFVTEIAAAGFEIDYVSPKGGYIPLDPRSLKHLKEPIFEMYLDNDFQFRALANSKKPAEINPADYIAIYYTGGHGVMWDFPENTALQEISLQIYQKQGYICSVCHGIAGLLNIKDSKGDYLISGKKITGFTTVEEYLSGKKSLVPFLNEKVAAAHGADFVKTRPFKSFVVQDKQLITGQNPQSATAVAKKLLQNIK